jgi:protease I
VTAGSIFLTVSAGDSIAQPRLKGCRVAFVIAPGYQEHEFWFPYYRFKEEGADVLVTGLEVGTIHGEGRHGGDGLPARVTHTIAEAIREKFDVLYLPGGLRASMILRAQKPMWELVRQALKQDRIVAATGYASWILISAYQAKGRNIACPLDMATDVLNAGGHYVAHAAVRDRNLVTAVDHHELPGHFALLIPLILEKTSGNAR